jgi:hemoglobin
MKKDIENREDIRKMVNTFYDKVKVDEKLGPIFYQVIGENWDPHLDKMVNFWESLLFHQPVYNGKPFPKHADLPIQELHFERWLNLFNENLDEHFSGSNTQQAKTFGSNIAKVFMAKLFQNTNSLPIV